MITTEEDCPSDKCYPKEYEGPKPIEEQIEAIAEIFNLDPTQALEYIKSLPELPEGAEGWFAIPRWQSVAPTFIEAVRKVLDLIINQVHGSFYHHEGQFSFLCQSVRTTNMLDMLYKEQEYSDILVFAAQFGMRHRGRAVYRVHEILTSNEFGLGVFEVAIMLRVHPERLIHYHHDLWINCAGDEFNDPSDYFEERALYFLTFEHSGKIKLNTLPSQYASASCGSATGFIPQ